MKRLISAVTAMLILTTCFVFPTSAATYIKKSYTMPARTAKVITISKSSKKQYLFAVKNNDDGCIKAKLEDNGATAKLTVISRRRTEDEKPSVIVYYKENSQNIKVRKFTFTVTPLERMEFENVRINPKTKKELTFTNPYADFLLFKPKTTKYIRFKKKAQIDGDKATYTVTAKKKGKTNVRVYLGNTGVYLGKFKITVTDVKTKIKPEYETLTLRYNKHGSSSYMADSHIMLSRLLTDVRYKARYTVELKDIGVADKITEKSAKTFGENKKTDFIYSTGKGSTTADVYEKLPKKAKALVGSFKIKVKSASMKYVAEQNVLLYDNDIMTGGSLNPNLRQGDKLNLRKTLTNTLVNNQWTGSSFTKSQYRFAYRSLNPGFISVDKNGTVTAKAASQDPVSVRFRIYFSDGTSFARNLTFTIR
ncbi:MAG: hypothetical protein IIU14_07260 [Ruminococcus sp.]|nr:hypothetical protein [Ruminococcus sp.]